MVFRVPPPSIMGGVGTLWTTRTHLKVLGTLLSTRFTPVRWRGLLARPLGGAGCVEVIQRTGASDSCSAKRPV